MAQEQLQPQISGTAEQNSVVRILTQRKHLHFKKGDTTFTADETRKKFYFLLSGRIKISQIHPQSSKEQTLYILKRGDMFDVITLLDNKEHYYIATALEPCEVVEVPIEHIRELIDTDPGFNRFFFPYLAKQMRHMEDLAIDLSLYDVYERLIRLIGRNMEEDDEGYHLTHIEDLSHEELAALVGTVRKVLNRNLQKLKEEGLIDIKRKELSVKDLHKLFEKIDLLE